MRKVRAAKPGSLGPAQPPPNSILGDILLESRAGEQSKKMVKVVEGGEGLEHSSKCQERNILVGESHELEV